MLDPNEPDTHTQETTEQPAAQPPRRRRAASRPAGPPSSAPDAPKIERAEDGSGIAGEAVVAGLAVTNDEAPPGADGVHSADNPAKKTAAKRVTKKAAKEASDEAEVPLKATRKRTAKKVTAMATETPSTDEAHTALTEPGEPAPMPDSEAVPVTERTAQAGPEDETEALAIPA